MHLKSKKRLCGSGISTCSTGKKAMAAPNGCRTVRRPIGGRGMDVVCDSRLGGKFPQPSGALAVIKPAFF